MTQRSLLSLRWCGTVRAIAQAASERSDSHEPEEMMFSPANEPDPALFSSGAAYDAAQPNEPDPALFLPQKDSAKGSSHRYRAEASRSSVESVARHVAHWLDDHGGTAARGSADSGAGSSRSAAARAHNTSADDSIEEELA
jgi:hypothetical protein